MNHSECRYAHREFAHRVTEELRHTAETRSRGKERAGRSFFPEIFRESCGLRGTTAVAEGSGVQRTQRYITCTGAERIVSETSSKKVSQVNRARTWRG